MHPHKSQHSLKINHADTNPPTCIPGSKNHPAPLSAATEMRSYRHTAAIEGEEKPLNAAGKDRDFQVPGGMGLTAGLTAAEARGAMLAAPEVPP